MQTVLRAATESDAPAIADLVNRAYRPSSGERGWTHEAGLVAGDRTTGDQVRALFREGSSVLVLEDGARIVACVHVERGADGDGGADIGMLATDPALQARGVGKRMLAEAERHAVAQFGASVLHMCVLSARPELLAFYLRRGYRRSGEGCGYPVDAGVGCPIVEGLRALPLVKDAADVAAPDAGLPQPPAAQPA